jgi:hypothetical protein
MSTGQLPVAKIEQKLVVLMAFDRNEEGALQPAFEPRQMPDERRAIQSAKEMATRHAGVIAWSRSADARIGDYGPPVELYRAGDVPDLD